MNAEELLAEWRQIRLERRAVPSASSIRQCEEQDEDPGGPCYLRGNLCRIDACEPCVSRMFRFTQIKQIAARLRSVQARMTKHAGVPK